jgi:hypothetical protein
MTYMLIFSNSISCIKDTKDFLASDFDIKNMQSEEAQEGKSGVANKCNEGGHTTLRQLRVGPPRRWGVV